MTADGYTSNPPSGGGGGGPIAISDVTGLTAALAAKLPIAGGTVTGALVVNGVLEVGTSVTLQIGADTNLYRVSANRLATDDSLDVGGDLLVYGNVDLQGTITGVAISDVSGLQAALDAKQASGSYAAASHTHTASAVTDLTEAVQDVVGAMVVAGSNVTATYDDGAGTLTIAASGGGGGTAPTFSRGHVVSGNVAIGADASWTPVTGLTIAIAAAEGDNVSLELACLISHTDSSFYELAVLVGGSPVRYASTNTSSPAGGNEGDPSMYPLTGGALHPLSTWMDFEVEAGDLSGGNVTFALMHLGSGGGQVYASSAFPFRWRARNDHQ